MGNTFMALVVGINNRPCPDDTSQHLISVAKDICPFPDYNPNPMFLTSLSINSSQHLSDHYAVVQGSLTPPQLDSFTQALRTTVGPQGIVNMGGTGVVALSLAVLFSSLARRVRGQCEPETGPLQGWFFKEEGGSYPPQVLLISDYLRLVPHIANNPARMREETESAF